MPLKYRPDIDGLRAIAVLAVVFYHTNLPGFSGGFVGVDIFFVLSGFLITSIILKDIKDEKFSIAKFYERRIRRIFPALFPVIAFVLVTGAYLFDPQAFSDLGKSVTATTLFYSNILFWRESGYFAAPSLQKPLLHTWSLAVEEQFYIFFPLALVFIHRYLKSRYLLWILVATTISLLASIYGVYHYAGSTFYLVPTRAWELLAGSILALGVLPNPSSLWLRNLLSTTGLALIIYSVGFYSEATLFPGLNAIAPVLGAWLIIYSNMGEGGRAIVNKILSMRPLVFVGLISYSLYLWHWPIVAFEKYLLFRPFNWYDSAAIILASLAVSTFSWKYIEQPFRGKKMLLPERKKLFVVSAFVMIAASGVGWVIDAQNGMPYRFPDADFAVMENRDPQWIDGQKNDKWLDGLTDGNTPHVMGSLKVSPSFALWGDSHSVALTSAVAETANHYNLSGYNITHTGVRPLLGMDNMDTPFNEAEYNRSVIDFLKSHTEIKTIFIAAQWADIPLKLKDITSEYVDQPTEVYLRAGLFRSVIAIHELGRDVVIVSDVPTLKNDPKRLFWISKRFGVSVRTTQCSQSINEYNELQKNSFKVFRDLQMRYNIRVLHPELLLFDKKGQSIVVLNNQSLYIDADHLSTIGSLYVAPVFDEVFRRMAAKEKTLQSR